MAIDMPHRAIVFVCRVDRVAYRLVIWGVAIADAGLYFRHSQFTCVNGLAGIEQPPDKANTFFRFSANVDGARPRGL